jgi:hypothetical protein
LFFFKKDYIFSYIIKFDKTKSFFQFEGNDLFDYSKLFGFSFGHHQHNESYRFAFRMINTDNIQIALYSYIKGKRVIEKICEFEYDQDYQLSIIFSKKNKIVHFEIKDLSTNKYIFSKFINVTNYKFWGYKLFPYIGGNNPAPKNIEFFMHK